MSAKPTGEIITCRIIRAAEGTGKDTILLPGNDICLYPPEASLRRIYSSVSVCLPVDSQFHPVSPARSRPLFFRIRSLFKIRPPLCVCMYVCVCTNSLSLPLSLSSYFIFRISVFSTNPLSLLVLSSLSALNEYSLILIHRV